MGEIGYSVQALFPFDSGEAVRDFINGCDDSNLAVVSGGHGWAVLTGDQVLFEGASLHECDDFLYGLVVGAVFFSDLASHPRWGTGATS